MFDCVALICVLSYRIHEFNSITKCTQRSMWSIDANTHADTLKYILYTCCSCFWDIFWGCWLKLKRCLLNDDRMVAGECNVSVPWCPFLKANVYVYVMCNERMDEKKQQQQHSNAHHFRSMLCFHFTSMSSILFGAYMLFFRMAMWIYLLRPLI